ncbi:MAG: response regulator transcription factor [Rubrobacteraceae bacterium]
MKQVLIVEDEAYLAGLLTRVLVEEGYAAESTGQGKSALRRAFSEDYDLLIVDWMLPDLDGLGLIRRLRAAEVFTPILMLTARAQMEDKVEGLEAGADDYLAKPFDLPELLARVRALTRRSNMESRSTAIEAGGVILDPARHVVRRGDERIDLTAREFALLATLMQRPGQVFTRSVLLDTIWGATDDVYANVVDLCVSHLRKKLDRKGETSYIRTVHGAGYAFDSQRARG